MRIDDSPRARRERQAADDFASTPLGFATNEARRERHRANTWRDVAVMLAAILALVGLIAWL